jgi:pimeloyl-ACP methyl ester carboxylesterase
VSLGESQTGEGNSMTASETNFVTSADGTRIAYHKVGNGPTLLVVNGALGFRGMSFARKAAQELAKHFTVIDYDRRGRGESGDQARYEVAREVEDLAALVQGAAGGPCYVFAQSSGAALALWAAAAGVPMKALVAYEPPYMIGVPKDHPTATYQARVTALIAAGRRDDALTLFMVTVGLPRFAVALMRLFPFWKDMRSTAHTLPYDAAVMGDFALPAERLASIKVPVVAVAGEKTAPMLKRAVREAARVIPGAQERVAPGMGHAIKPSRLAPLLAKWFYELAAPVRGDSGARLLASHT